MYLGRRGGEEEGRGGEGGGGGEGRRGGKRVPVMKLLNHTKNRL